MREGGRLKGEGGSRHRRAVRVLLFCLLPSAFGLLTSGCVHRQLTVRSEPPGALLMLNDKKMGTTPFSYDFMWYGTYRVILTKDGYETLYDKPTLRAPWYLRIPLDLMMELWPGTIKDVREWSYQLVKREEPLGPTAPVYEETPDAPAAASGEPMTEDEHGSAR